MKGVVSPGASSHHDATAAYAKQTEVGEQARAAQDASHDDQHDQRDEQRRGAARNTTPLAGARWWGEWLASRPRRSGSGWFQGVIRRKPHGLEFLRRSRMPIN